MSLLIHAGDQPDNEVACRRDFFPLEHVAKEQNIKVDTSRLYGSAVHYTTIINRSGSS